MKDALILLNGDIPFPGMVRRLARAGAAVLCADGGARHAAALSLHPRVIIGDMDSLPGRLPPWKDVLYLCDFDPNTSDFEKALRFAERRAFRRAGRGLRGRSGRDRGPAPRVWVAGALGRRIDHTAVNLALMERYSAGLSIALADAPARILGPGIHRIPARKGQTLSVLPATSSARVSLSGVRHPLSRALLNRSSRGLSNRALSSTVRVRVHAGRLWFFLPRTAA